ncbi:MAG: hypothetical protein H7X97_09780 [Opitutaceae bacterium]|nr:hypothetical protein [Verrucomicrobiales bacterium]
MSDIEEYLSRNGWAGATRRTHWIDIRSLFSFAVKRGQCRENVASQVEAPILDAKPPGVLTVAQCAALLDACQRRRPEVLSWLTLCLFAGVCVEEALRLTAEAIQSDHILISALKAKTRRRRLVPITPQIRAGLDAAKPHCKKLIPSKWRKCFAEIRRAVGLCQEWPQNAIRHSFISYHVARYRNENETALIAGTSPAMTYKHCREIVRPKEAEEFFALLPDAAALLEGARVTAGRAKAIHAARVAAGKKTSELTRKRALERIGATVLAGPVATEF